jgi:hypothetical protein
MSNLVNENIQFLRQGTDLLNALNDELYCQVVAPYFSSGVGKHIRHNLDHYESFLAGLAGGRINYDARRRDQQIETDRRHAIQKILSIISRLDAIPDQALDHPILVTMNDVAETEAPSQWGSSTVRRELQFLLSHTVHHYAIVAMILKIQGFDCGKDFGVAPSTLKYERRPAQCIPSLG